MRLNEIQTEPDSQGITNKQRRELMKSALVGAASVVAVTALPGSASAADVPKKATGAVPDGRLTAPLTVPANGVINVAFLISPAAEIVDFGGPWGVFEYVYIGKDYKKPFKLYTVGASKESIEISGGMRIEPNYTIADAPAPNVVVVPALDTSKLAPAALDWLRQVHQNTDVTMSVCNGSFVLAKAGLLDGKNVTAHHGGYGSLRAEYPKVNVIRGARYVEDGKIATAGGLTSGSDLALRVVERYFGREEAKSAAFKLEYQGTGWMYPKSNAQFAKKPVGTNEHPVCPVCEGVLRRIKKETALNTTYKGKTYYFCGEWCHTHFMATPERFAEPSR